MYYELCLGCGVKLPPNVEECPVCGFNSTSDLNKDFPDDQEFFDDIINDGIPEDNPY